MTPSHKLFFKPFIKYLLTLSIPVILLGSFAFTLTYRYIYENAATSSIQALEQANQYIDQIYSICKSVEQSVNPDAFSSLSLKHILHKDTLSYDDSIRLSIFSSNLNSIANANSNIESIYIYWPNASGKLLASNRGILLPDMLTDSEWKDGYEKALSDHSGQTYIQKRMLSTGHQRQTPVITCYHKIYTLDYASSQGMVIVNLKSTAIEDYLKRQKTYPEQQLYLADKTGELLVGTNFPSPRQFQFVKQAISNLQGNNQIFTQAPNTVSISGDTAKQLYYITVIPNRQLYAIPRKLFIITACLTVLSLFLSLTLAAVYSKRTSRNIDTILQIFSSAQEGKKLPSQPTINDEYSYIITNLISTFIQQEYLTVQLSEKAYKARTLELMALQTQINPHFLFNTLETIHLRAFGLTGKANDVTYLLENLSRIMRYALSDPDKRIPFKEELNYTRAYLNIQKFRYKEKFHVIWEYDDDLAELSVIKLLIQPMIENAIYHGIKEAPRECVIKIRAYSKHGIFVLHIIDTGIGMKKEKLKELRLSLNPDIQLYEHIGISNTYKRLLLTYGESVSMRIQSKYLHGTAITIKFPAHHTP